MSIPLLSTKIRATSWRVFDESSSHSINIVDFLLKTITARSQAMAKEKTGALIFLTDAYLCLSLSKIYYKRPCITEQGMTLHCLAYCPLILQKYTQALLNACISYAFQVTIGCLWLRCYGYVDGWRYTILYCLESHPCYTKRCWYFKLQKTFTTTSSNHWHYGAMIL